MKTAYLLLILLLIPSTLAEVEYTNFTNTTQPSTTAFLNTTLDQGSTTIKNGLQQLEDWTNSNNLFWLWPSMVLALFIMLIYARTSIKHQTAIWKLGLIIGMIILLFLFIMTR